jgi:DNA ligase-1
MAHRSENSANDQSAPFAGFAATCEKLAATAGRLERTRLVADYLRELAPDEARQAARFFTGRAFAESEGRRLSVSGRTVAAALRSIGIDLDATGGGGIVDFGDWVRRAIPASTHEGELSLADLETAFRRIAAAEGGGSRTARIERLAELFRRATPLEAKYIAKIAIGEMRHGVQDGIVLDAVAQLAATTGDGVRRAFQAIGDVGELARMARTDPASLASAEVVLFRPIKPMLAQTAADVAEAFVELGGRLALEWKLDGARLQIHKRGDEVRLFSRRMKDITASLPDVAALVSSRAAAETAIFEGEVIPVAEGRPLPFQELMRRFRRKRNVEEMIAEVPVALALFDILHLDGRPLLDLPARERWLALEPARGGLDTVGRSLPIDAAEGTAFYDQAVAAGYEGVMAKALDSPYTPGVRGKSWLKIKHDVTLDLVVVAADWGYGRRHGWLSNYHLAARDAASGGLVEVGKTFKGLTDAQFAAMTELLLRLKLREERGTVFVRPEVVVEVKFNDIQKSPTYACGMALRFARIVRIRDDKSAGEADTIETLRELFEKSLGV